MSGEWRGDTLNITCNFLYCNHQVHRDFLITLYMLILIIIFVLVLFPGLDAHIIDVPSINFSHYAHILTNRCKQHTNHFTITYTVFTLLLLLPDSNSTTLYAARLKQYHLTFFYQTYHGYGAHGGAVD